jgi:hypothetical protein
MQQAGDRQHLDRVARPAVSEDDRGPWSLVVVGGDEPALEQDPLTGEGYRRLRQIILGGRFRRQVLPGLAIVPGEQPGETDDEGYNCPQSKCCYYQYGQTKASFSPFCGAQRPVLPTRMSPA